jgi:hypothetical protein
MSRLSYNYKISTKIRKAFRCVDNPTSPEMALWRERAARMTLDALGFTGLISKRKKHNDTISHARRWFRGCYDSTDIPLEFRDSAIDTFDSGGIDFQTIKSEVLKSKPIFQGDADELEDEEGSPGREDSEAVAKGSTELIFGETGEDDSL